MSNTSLWLCLMVLSSGVESQRVTGQVVRQVVSAFSSIHSVSMAVLDEPVVKARVARALDEWYISSGSVPGDRASSGWHLHLIFGTCLPALTHALSPDRGFFHKKSKIVIISQSFCPLTSEAEFSAFLATNATRSIRLWWVNKDSGTQGQYHIWSGVFWNAQSPVKVINLGPIQSQLELLDDTLMDLQGVKIRTATVGGDLALTWDSEAVPAKDGEWLLTQGLSFEIFDYVRQKSGLEQFIVPPSTTWGSGKDLLGMTGAIARDEADVVGTMLAQCCDRDLIMNYLTPVTFRHFYVYFKQPNLANDIFLSQFNLVVWMTCLAMVLALCLSMILTILVGVREPNATRAAFSTLDSVSWTFCLVSQRGFEKEPSAKSQRILFVTGFIFGMVCFCGFSANIITTLSQSRSLDTFKALMDYDPIQIGFSSFPYFLYPLRASQNAQVMRMLDRMQIQSDCSSETSLERDQALASRVSDGTVVATFGGPDDYIFDPHLFTFMKNRATSCDLTYFEIPKGIQWMTYGISKKALFEDDINLAFLRLKETGLLQKILKDHYPKPPECLKKVEAAGYREVSINFVFTAFFILLGGQVLAVLLCFLETLVARGRPTGVGMY